ncbi:MAG: transcriptional regulator NrdR [Candidatus Magasanikbacteria bacterium]|nr:transcriptional regulator NrdR [Candidatus Magasanikbacteria bacterium]
MRCPVCNNQETSVVDTRSSSDGLTIRRRRECDKCSYRFSTVEEIELLDIVVVKSDGHRESYMREKIERGIKQSLSKRPYTAEKFNRLLHSIERDIQKRKKREISSKDIGEIVMKHLRNFDKVAYIRFASVYRDFRDVKTFEKELKKIGKGRSA